MNQSTLKDLQSILEENFGKDLIVDNYEVKDFLPPGENYGSKIVSVDAKIRRKLGKSEDIYLVCKLPPPTLYQREMFDSPFTFRKEIAMYAEILPAYRKLEIDNGVSEQEAFDNYVTYYGSRLSMDPDVNFDDDAAIALENLKPKGYYMVNRRVGCDLHHAKLTIRALARFHSLAIAMKHNNPSYFDILKIKAKCLEFKNPEQWIDIMKSIMNFIKEDEMLSKYYEQCEKVSALGTAESWLATPPEPWSSIIHGDFWVNNMLFHKSKNGLPDDVKFVDFQNYLFLSPLQELAFFLSVSVDFDVINNHYDELVNLYYDNLIQRLQLLNCNTSAYSRTSFDQKLRDDARLEFSHVVCMAKIITMDVKDDNPDKHHVKKLLEASENNEVYIHKIRAYVMLLQKRGWLDD